MKVRRDWRLDFDVDDVLRSQSADPAVIRTRRPKLVELAEQALAEGRNLLAPAVLTRRVPVAGSRHNRVTLADGNHLTGPLVTEHLGGASEVVVILCTIGNDLSEIVAQHAETKLIYALALDAVGSAAVHSLNAAACNVVEQNAAAAGLQTGLPLSPGMEGWGVRPGQQEVFSIIDGAEVGVTLTPTLQMQPLKSLTTVIGVGRDIASTGAICDYCPLRDTCRHRIA